MTRLFTIICGVVLLGFALPAGAADGPVYEHGVVAADHPLASAAGVEILRRGGNVVDAAVATGFALSVVRPASSGLGGGGFMVIWNAETREPVVIDYRERAPARATRDMFAEAGKASAELSQTGHLAVAVPGHVAGLCYALEHYGTLKPAVVLEPAIRFAREGVLPDAHEREVQAGLLARFERNADERERFRPLIDLYLNRGIPWKAGDRFHSPQLRVLEIIAREGAKGFYAGPVAEALAAESRRGGGLLTLEDLAAMRPAVREPIRGRFGNLDIITMPPPSSGGIALVETLNILSAFGEAHPARALERLKRNSPEYVHLLTESLKHAFADRAEFLGDPDFVDIPAARLTSLDYARRLAAAIDMRHTQPAAAYGRFQPVDDGGTTHFSVIDIQGNAVACTETINTEFGSLVVEPEYGIVLNNEMDDFAAVPGKPNAFGLLQSEANAVGPGKRPLSSMTPTIVVRDGKAVHALGGSGGPRIISATLQVLLNLTWHEMTPEAAIAEPRLHHQWMPDVLLLEEPHFGRVADDLRTRGHVVERRSGLAAVQAASRTARGLRGAADPRKHGQAAGY